jgi:hypothetical protein
MNLFNRKILVFIVGLFLLFSEVTFGQLTIEKSSVDSGGAVAESSGLEVIYSIGEVAVAESSSGISHISEGFISPELFNTVGIRDFGVLGGVTLSPNPTSDFLMIDFLEKSDYLIEIYTMDGKQLYTKIVENQLNHTVDFQYYPASVYLIIVKDVSSKVYKSYKLIKE